MGCGGIGGTVAAELALAGHQVSVVEASTDHLTAIRTSGLYYDGLNASHRVQFHAAVASDELRALRGVVILAVKSQHTDAAIDQLLPHLDADTVVVSLQNGWNANRIAERIGTKRTIGAMVHLVGNYLGPGHVRRFSRGDLYIGEMDGTDTHRVHEIREILAKVTRTHTTRNVRGYIWSKQIYGCTMPVSALVDQPAREIFAPDWVKTILLGLILEGIQVADVLGVHLEPYERYDPQAMRITSADHLPVAIAMLPHGSSKGNSGVWHDIKRGRRTEIDHLQGEIVHLGQRHGLPMTLNAEVVSMIHEIESGQREMSWANLQRLREPAQSLVDEVIRSHMSG